VLGLLLAAALASAGEPAAPAAPRDPRAEPAPPRPAPLRELRLDAWDAALAQRWGRLFAVAGRILEQAPLDAEAYRLAGDAALLGGLHGEARRLLGKAQLIAPSDATERLLKALDQPFGPPAPDAPPAPPGPDPRALAWLDLGENRHLSVPSFTCHCAARALEADPQEARATAVRASLRCPPEAPAAASPGEAPPSR
jgi:hypothetical protein